MTELLLPQPITLDFEPRSPARRWLGLPPPVPPTDLEQAALQHFNAGRQAVGRPPVQIETALCDVARAYARLLALHGPDVAAASVDALMDWVGLVDPYPGFLAWSTQAGGDAPFLLRLRRLGQRSAVASAPTELQGHELVGVGRAEGPQEWTHVLVRVARLVSLEPLPRRHTPGSALHLRGRLAAGVHGTRAFTLAPGERVQKLRLRHQGEGRFYAQRSLPEQPGRMLLEITGRTARGPLVLARLALLVGDDSSGAHPEPTPDPEAPSGALSPRVGASPSWDPLDPALLPGASGGSEDRLRLLMPPDDDAALDAEAARQRLLQLINGSRARHGLPLLEHDRLAGAVAQRHAEEMAQRGFTGHLSPRSGTPGDRFRKAGLAVTLLGECVARDRSVSLAFFALMRSLAHRAALLDRRFLAAGLGAATQTTAGHTELLVACELLRPLVHPDPDASGPELAQEITFLRALQSRPALQPAADLRHVARQATTTISANPKAAAAPLQALMEGTLGARGRGGWEDYAALVRGVTDPLALSAEEELVDPRWTHMGLHVRLVISKREGLPVCVVAVVLGRRAPD